MKADCGVLIAKTQHPPSSVGQRLWLADMDRVSRIYWLLEDCKRYGTLPFAGLARAGFIAVQLLRSLVSVGVLDPEDCDSFMNGLTTVSGQMSRDLSQLDRSNFLAKYGHLRPGTYDLLSPRYDEAPDVYFDWDRSPSEPHRPSKPFALSLAQMRAISALLDEHGLEHDVVGLFDFLQAGIELREYAKFVFSRNLSDAMSLLRDLGAEHGFSTEDMAYADIQCVYELYSAGADPVALLADSITRGKAASRREPANNFASGDFGSNDVFAFEMPASEPNHHQHQVRAASYPVSPAVRFEGSDRCDPNADPGFDWLFSDEIGGLITACGVNSIWLSAPVNSDFRRSSAQARFSMESGLHRICCISTALTGGSRCCGDSRSGEPTRDIIAGRDERRDALINASRRTCRMRFA